MKKGWEHVGRFFVFSIWMVLIAAIGIDLVGKVMWRVYLWIILLGCSFAMYHFIRHLSLLSNVLFNLIVLFEFFGEVVFSFFYTLVSYDKIGHFFNPLIGIFIAHDFLKKYIKNERKRIIFAGAILIAFSIVWELLEVLLLFLFDAPMMGVILNTGGASEVTKLGRVVLGPVKDTIYDLILSVGGPLLMVLIWLKMIKRKSNVRIVF